MRYSQNGVLVWKDGVVRERLAWYYSVMTNTMPAKFRICKKVPCDDDLSTSTLDELWVAHLSLQKSFKETLEAVENGTATLDAMPKPNTSLLDLKSEILHRMLESCIFCEWRCRVNRLQEGRRGACKMDSTTRVSTWFHHFGEEPPIVGFGGSGTIFFAGCTMRCVFCQNWDISQDYSNGVAVSSSKLALIMKSLRDEGASNINFVGGEPTPNLHTILDSMRHLDTNVPMLWNSNMYMSLEAMTLLKDVIDIWLPDFKYGNDRCALRLSKIVRYFDTAARNHLLAQEKGDMVIRHLVLPGHLECCTKPILSWISENCPRALVNIMGQYHPDYKVAGEPNKYQEISRRPSRDEMTEAFEYAGKLGVVFEPVS